MNARFRGARTIAAATCWGVVACVPPTTPEPSGGPQASATQTASARPMESAAVATSDAVVTPSADAPTAMPTSLESLPMPSAWGCPPVEAPIEVVATTAASALAGEGGDLFWADAKGLWKKSGETEATLLSKTSPQLEVTQLVVSGDDVFLVASRDMGRTCSSVVQSVPRAGGSAKTVISGRCVKHLAVSDSHVAALVASYDPVGDWVSAQAWLSARDKPQQGTKIEFDLPVEGSLAFANGRLFASHGGGRVYAARLEPNMRFSAVSQNATVRQNFSSADPRAFGVDEGFAYVYASGATNTALRVLRVKVDGSAPEVLGGFPRERPTPFGRGFILGERWLYFTVPNDGAVYRADKQAKCGIDKFAADRKQPTALALAGGAVHWVEGASGGQIVRRRE